LLDLWDPLEAYYKEDPKENVLLKPIENKVIKIYLQFLSIFLEKVNSVNQYFQREVSEVFEIKNQLMKVFTGFSNHIFKPSIKVKDEIKLVDPVTRFNLNLNQNIDEYLLTPREMFEHFKLVFKNVIDIDILEEKDQKTVCKDFQKFILQILKGLKKYLPFDDVIISKISTLDPEKFDSQYWIDLVQTFPNIVSSQEFHQVYDELSNWTLDLQRLKEEKEKYTKNSKFDVIQFYNDVRIKQSYPLMSKLGRAILSMPHSGAAIERVFSQLKIIKNERRNCLQNETLESLLISKVNDIDLSDKQTFNKIFNVYEKKNSDLKRKRSAFSESVNEGNISIKII